MTSTQPTVQQGPAVTGRFTEEPADEPRRPLTHRTNNFDFLRLLGALAVVLGHAYHLVGAGQYTPGMLGQPVQALGVIIFFSISGYLITASWSRSRDVVSYTAARVLRIFPALVVVVVLSAYVLGPLVTTLPAGTYLSDPTTVDYLRNIHPDDV